MKTLAIVFSALAAVAIAAPTLLQENLEDAQKTKLPETLKRERKSPQEIGTLFDPALDSPANLPQLSEFGLSGRSIALKKPIIVKRKQGIHVYRDSDEQPAGSGEICGDQVKVKFCEPKSDPTLRSTTVEDLNIMTEDEMIQNIQLAKEAIENLQRDLKNEETPKSWKHEQSASDAKLHQEIEVARKALEQIHKNFGKLEAMNMPAITAANSESSQNKEFAIAHTDEQRLAQWKEAMDSIRKNSEIVRNIEDSFKETSHVTGLASDMHDLSKDHAMKAAEEVKTKEENAECKTLEKSSCNKFRTSPELTDDMALAASTNSETVIKNNHETEKEKIESKVPALTHTDVLDAAKDTILFEESLQKHKTLTSDSMKIMEENKEINNKPETEHKKDAEIDSSPSKVKVRESDTMTKIHTTQMKNMDEQKMKMMKSAEMINEKSHLEMKTADHMEKLDDLKKKEELMHENNDNVNMKPGKHTKEHLSHQSHEARKAHSEEPKHPAEAMGTSSHHHLQSFLHPEMRSSDEVKDMMHHQMRKGEDHFLNSENMHSMKLADGMHPDHNVPSHHLHHAANSHHPSTAHGTHHARVPDFMMKAKSADNMDMQTYYMAARDGTDMDGHRLRWKAQHEEMPMSMRGAYGAPTGQVATSGSTYSDGAVGVFPNANLPSSYGIPLLLSCNPSVVRGNLAKQHAAYTAPPAYRSEYDFNLHNMKRNVRKTHETQSTLPHKTIQSDNLKDSNVLVAKQ